jgi:integrase/recombinase XerD
MQLKQTGYSNKADWLADPVKAFDAFIASEDYARTSARNRNTRYAPLKPGSIEVYRAMFATILEWLTSKRLHLFSIDRQQLRAFLEATDEDGARKIRSEIAYRYVRMLERIYRHLQIHPNAASELVIDTVKSSAKLGENEDMVVLSADETARFIAALPPESVNYRGAKPGAGWKHRRDRALQMTLLGAGLTVYEAVHLQWSQYNLEEITQHDGLPIKLRRGNFEHTTTLQAFAVPYLKAWEDERRNMAIPGPYAFPSHFDDKNSLFGEKKPLDVVSVYRQIANTFRRAGIERIHVGGRNLRNTFAIRLLEQGVSRDELQQRLGLALPRSVDRYVDVTAKLEK